MLAKALVAAINPGRMEHGWGQVVLGFSGKGCWVGKDKDVEDLAAYSRKGGAPSVSLRTRAKRLDHSGLRNG